MIGYSNKRILQVDGSSGEVQQQYEEHTGAINSINFVDFGKRFISSADDKKIYLWEFGIPVVAKHVSDPEMQSIPVAKVHPSGASWAG